MATDLKITALAGGVGGAKLVDGLAQVLSPTALSIIVNVGDDFEHLGLKVCPDLDTVCYTLADRANQATGWGLANETWNTLESMTELGGPTWFRLGDRDLGTHLERTRRLRAGGRLSEITQDFCQAWGVEHKVYPVTDADVPTRVYSNEGELAFQDYFVRRQCSPQVRGFSFVGAESARPAPGVLNALQSADWVIICPSNPWVSIDPILAIGGVRDAVMTNKVLAVSPIIGGRTIKGPAAKMYLELGIVPSAKAVAAHYGKLLDAYVMDERFTDIVKEIRASGVSVLVTDTLMMTRADRKRLALKVIEFCN